MNRRLFLHSLPLAAGAVAVGFSGATFQPVLPADEAWKSYMWYQAHEKELLDVINKHRAQVKAFRSAPDMNEMIRRQFAESERRAALRKPDNDDDDG